MHSRHLLLSVLTLAIWFAGATQLSHAQDASFRQRMETAKAGYERSVDQEVTQPFIKQVAELEAGYVKVLQAAMEAETASQRLEEATALRAEIQRVQSKQAMPREDDSKTPPVLVKLRGVFRPQLALLEKERAARMTPLVKKLDEYLVALQHEASQAKDLEAALAVKQYRESLPARSVFGSEGPLVALTDPGVQKVRDVVAEMRARERTVRSRFFKEHHFSGKASCGYNFEQIEALAMGYRFWTQQQKTEALGYYGTLKDNLINLTRPNRNQTKDDLKYVKEILKDEGLMAQLKAGLETVVPADRAVAQEAVKR